jgi:hypothetical protein
LTGIYRTIPEIYAASFCGIENSWTEQVGAVALWSGSDNGNSAPTSHCGKMDKQRSYEQWLMGAKIVPRACMPHQPALRG